jgi:glycosyltransferase involved in cell wall biosynthesis
MRILYVITGLGMGGAETQVCALADTLSAKGEDVSIAYLTGPLVAKPKNELVKVIPIGVTKSPVSVLLGMYKLSKLIRNGKFDVVHSHMIHANILCRVLRPLTGKYALISSAHNNNEGGSIRMAAYRFTDFLTDISTNVSNDALERFIELKAFPRERCKTVSNGVNLSRFNSYSNRSQIRTGFGVDENTPIVIAVGRNAEAKDYPNLLRALSLLKRNNLKVLIVGKDVDLLQPMVEELKLGHMVEMLGVRKDIEFLMSAADIFVLSSAWEGMPMVVGEAMASKCAIVASDAGGTRDWLPEGTPLASVRNSEQLASLIEDKLQLSNQELIDEGVRNREYVSNNYSIDVICTEWLMLYAKYSFQQ